MAQFRDSSSEKAALREKRIELDALRARHDELRTQLQRLRLQVIDFEREYDERLGRRMAELERIEAEIRMLGGNSRREEPAPPREHRERRGSASGQWRSEAQDIKSLYRDVAKAVHPDLVPAGAAQQDRNALMSRANQAYRSNDRRTLQEILSRWGNLSSAVDSELAYLDRQIAKEREALGGTAAKVEQLRNSFACRFNFKSGPDSAGATLLAEMVHAVDLQIERAREQLSKLRSAEAQQRRQGSEQDRRGTRRLHFLEEYACGVLYVRDRTSSNYSQWRRVGSARGEAEVYFDQAVRLDVKVQAGMLAALGNLKADDLQSLFLYGACDADIPGIGHLTGLEELYLSGVGLSDTALRSIASLTGLKRIYIYQTGITDVGLSYLQHLPNLAAITSSGNGITEAALAGFERAIPRVKTTSFQWKR